MKKNDDSVLANDIKRMKEQFEELKTTLKDFIQSAENKYATKEELKEMKINMGINNTNGVEWFKARGGIIVALITLGGVIITGFLNK